MGTQIQLPLIIKIAKKYNNSECVLQCIRDDATRSFIFHTVALIPQLLQLLVADSFQVSSSPYYHPQLRSAPLSEDMPKG